MTFNNSILSGTTLARENIQSEGFVSGSTGWQITRDGDAEFNDIVARGDIESIGINSTARLNGGSLIIEDNVDPSILSRLTISTLEFQGDNEKGNVIYEDDATAPRIGFELPTITQRGVFLVGDTGFLHATDGFPTAVETWNNLGFANGWGNSGGAYSNGQYKLMPDGTVHFRGMIGGPVVADATLVAGVAAGYFPPGLCIFTVPTIAPAAQGGIAVTNNGSVLIYGGVASASLEGITFSII